MNRIRTIGRRGLLALVLYVLVPILLLGLIESGLRAAGIGGSTAWLLERPCKQGPVWTPNRAFYQQFSNIPLRDFLNWDELDFVMPSTKAADTIRIFAFGESALFGDRSAARMVEVMLAERYPGKKIELFNAACPGMTSHVLRAAAKEAAKHQPDCFLIYMGNNEAVGPYGGNTPIARTRLLWHPPIIQALIAVNDLRLLQALTPRDARPWAPPTPEQLANSVPGQVDSTRVNRMFNDNLSAMAELAEDAGGSTVVCTLSFNRAFGGAQPEPRPLERTELNQHVLDTAQRASVTLADVDLALHNASPSGTPDYGFFIDNIHFRFEGNYVAACAMYHGIVEALSDRLPTATEPLPRERVAELLGWTPAAEVALLRIQVEAGFDDYSKELLRERLVELEQEVEGDLYAPIAKGYEKALEARPDDLYLLHGRFESLLYGSRHAEALAMAEVMATFQPCACVSIRAEARAAGQLNMQERSMDAFDRVLELYPDDDGTLHALSLMKSSP